ncbi:NAD-glutamate dehydrogenase [Streptomyces sp. NBC_00454]
MRVYVPLPLPGTKCGAGSAGTANVRGCGWTSSRSVVDVVTDDMPFLVDSATNELATGTASTSRSTRSPIAAMTGSAR